MVRGVAICPALRPLVERRYAPLTSVLMPLFRDSVRHSLTYMLENSDE